MKKLKKITLLLAILAFASMFCGCGSKVSLEGSEFMVPGGSKIVLNEDGTYFWYENPAVTDDNYFAGKYMYFTGAEARKYLINDLPSYKLTDTTLDGFFDKTDKEKYYTTDKEMVIVMSNTESMINGQKLNVTPAHYFGYFDGQYYDAVSLENQSRATFIKTK